MAEYSIQRPFRGTKIDIVTNDEFEPAEAIEFAFKIIDAARDQAKHNGRPKLAFAPACFEPTEPGTSR